MALQVGNANQVAAVDKFSLVITMILAFVLLQEKVTWQSVVGGRLDYCRNGGLDFMIFLHKFTWLRFVQNCL